MQMKIYASVLFHYFKPWMRVVAYRPETDVTFERWDTRLWMETVKPTSRKKALHALLIIFFTRLRIIPQIYRTRTGIAFQTPIRIAGSTRESIPLKSCQAYLRFLAQTTESPPSVVVFHYLTLRSHQASWKGIASSPDSRYVKFHSVQLMASINFAPFCASSK